MAANLSYRRLDQALHFLADPKLDGRVPGTEGHRIAQEYLLQQMRDLEMLPLFDGRYEQEILGEESMGGRNLCGFYPGRASRRLILGAHYDHLAGIPGADDNAASVAILLDVAERLRESRLQLDVVFCFFDQEEPPFFLNPWMGSLYFAAHPPFDLQTTFCAIILDSCAHDIELPERGVEKSVLVMGAESAAFLVDAVRAVDTERLPLLMARNKHIGDLSDHAAFRHQEVPYLFFNSGMWSHYHRPSDTLDKLDPEKIHRIADSLVALAGTLDAMYPVDPIRYLPSTEFLPIEAESIKRLTGRDVPATRQALDAAVQQIVDEYGMGFTKW